MSEDVFIRARRQGLWLAIGQGAVRMVQLATTVALARLLLPDQFGVVAIAAVVWEIVSLFGNTGVAATLVHRRGEIDLLCDAAFWLNAIVAALLGVVSLGVAAAAARFYEEPLLLPFMGFYAAAFLISSAGTVSSALLTREMAFGRLAFVDGLCALASSVGMVALAAAGAGAWSLVLPAPAVALLRVVLLFRVCPWRPGLRPRPDLWGRIAGYGLWVLGADLAGYLNLNGDYLIAGKTLGEHALGIYALGYRVANWPVETGVWLVSRIAFPAFSNLQGDPGRLASAFVRMLRAVGVIAFPAVAVLFVVTPDLVAVLYGEERWGGTVPLIRIILICVPLRALASPASQILLATGRVRELFLFGAAVTPFLLGGVLYGTRFGLVGVAWATASVLAVASLALVAVSWRRSGASPREVPAALLPGVAVAAATAAAAWGAGRVILLLGAAWMPAGVAPGSALPMPMPMRVLMLGSSIAAGGLAGWLTLRTALRDDYEMLMSGLGGASLMERWRQFRDGVAWSLGRRQR